MRRLLLIILLFASVVSAQAGDCFDVVFDIDWTLSSKVTDGIVVRDPSRILEIEGERYIVADGVVEALNFLRHLPNVCLSYFSGGTPSRNETFLRKIILDPASGLTAYDVMHQRLNVDQMEDLYPNDTQKIPFRQRRRKNLEPFFEDLRRVILFDDVQEFAAAGQERNLLWTGATYEFFETFSDTIEYLRKKGITPYVPLERADWEFERNRIPIFAMIIAKAVQDESDPEKKKIPFIERVQKYAKEPKKAYLDEWRKTAPRSVKTDCGILLLKAS